MDDPTTSKPPATATTRAANARRQEKNARKRAAREAARRAAVRKQRQAALGVFAAIVVVVVGIVLIVKFTGGSPKADTTASSLPSGAATAPTATATDATTAPAVPFPPVPAGADPALKTKPVVKGGTGDVPKLDVKTLIQGTGATVKSGDSITVNYVGVTYADGKEFDSSWSHSQAFTTAIGQNTVIAGWDQGLVGVKVGSRVQLDIPKALAYPTADATNGQPQGALRFVVDILADQPAS